MNETVLNPGWDTLAIAIPFLIFMAIGMFRLDELIAAPKRRNARPRTFCGPGQDGYPVLSDPDGRPSSFPPASGRASGGRHSRVATGEPAAAQAPCIQAEILLHVKENKADVPVELIVISKRTILRKSA